MLEDLFITYVTMLQNVNIMEFVYIKASIHDTTLLATCANQLNSLLSGWGILIGSHQRLLQPVARKVGGCFPTKDMQTPSLRSGHLEIKDK